MLATISHGIDPQKNAYQNRDLDLNLIFKFMIIGNLYDSSTKFTIPRMQVSLIILQWESFNTCLKSVLQITLYINYRG